MATARTGPRADLVGRAKRWWAGPPGTVAKVVLAGALLALVIWQGWGELSGIRLSRLTPGWLPALVLAELASGVALVAGQAVLLGAGGWLSPPGEPGTRGLAISRLSSTTLAATAIGYILPGGPALSAAYAARRYRKYGVASAAAAQSQVATAAAAGIGLGLVALVGTVLPGAVRQASLAAGPQVLLLGAAAVMVASCAAVMALVGSARSRRYLTRSRLVGLVTGCPPVGAGAKPPPRLGAGRLVSATGLTVASVLLDVGCLVAALHAARVAVPWHALLLAYGAAQLLALLPFTPGGAGFVEGGLAALLAGAGTPGRSLVLAVVVYRGISWAAWVLVGGVALVVHRRSDAAAAAQARASRAATVTSRRTRPAQNPPAKRPPAKRPPVKPARATAAPTPAPAKARRRKAAGGRAA